MQSQILTRVWGCHGGQSQNKNEKSRSKQCLNGIEINFVELEDL